MTRKPVKNSDTVTLSAQLKTTYWLAGAAAGVILLWLLGNAVLPFLIATAIAYFVEPVVVKLQQRGMNRLWATIVISLLALLVVIALLLLVVPMVVQQATALITVAPEYVAG